MKKMMMAVLVLAVTLTAGTVLAQEKAETGGATLANLQTAYDGESNAQARYEAFAKKADAEGYGQVASLFRAAAKSESIHAAGLAKTIQGMGASPKADVKAPQVKTTKENLAAAFKGESYERDTMYPGFLKQAEVEKNENAARNFKGAMAAETEHAKFYGDAQKNLEQWKNGKKDFLVCTVCGYTTVDMAITKCPVCSSPRSKFVTVN